MGMNSNNRSDSLLSEDSIPSDKTIQQEASKLTKYKTRRSLRGQKLVSVKDTKSADSKFISQRQKRLKKLEKERKRNNWEKVNVKALTTRQKKLYAKALASSLLGGYFWNNPEGTFIFNHVCLQGHYSKLNEELEIEKEELNNKKENNNRSYLSYFNPLKYLPSFQLMEASRLFGLGAIINKYVTYTVYVLCGFGTFFIIHIFFIIL